MKKRSMFRWDDATPYLMIIPTLIAISFVHIYPSLTAIRMAFFDISLLKKEQPFIGLQNFERFFSDPTNLRVLANTFFWMVMTITFGMSLALLIAVQLNKRFRGRTVLRSLYLAPWVTPGVVVAAIWVLIFDKNLSPINSILMKLGITETGIAFLGNPTMYFGFLSFPMIFLIIINLWGFLPFTIVMFLSGLQTIPTELYEAAVIDGASRRSQFRHITIPLLLPVMEITILLQCIWQFNNFNLSYLVTGGGPLNTTELIAVRVYTQAFVGFKYGYAAAISVVMLMVIMIPAIVYIVKVRKEEATYSG